MAAGTVLLRTSERTVLQVVEAVRLHQDRGQRVRPSACGLTLLLVTVTSRPPVPLRPMISMPRPLGVCRIVLLFSSSVASEPPLMLTRMPLPIAEPESATPALPIVLPLIVPVNVPPKAPAAAKTLIACDRAPVIVVLLRIRNVLPPTGSVSFCWFTSMWMLLFVNCCSGRSAASSPSRPGCCEDPAGGGRGRRRRRTC